MMVVQRSSLFIVDGSLDRPLLHSQGLPLLRCLSASGTRCFVQSFESSPACLQSSLASDLATSGIIWRPVYTVSGSGGLSRLGVIIRGFSAAARLIQQESISLVHARSYRPGVIGAILKGFFRVPFLFDMRGFLIDELVADGRWRAGGIKYRLAKYVEKWLFMSSDTVITTSPQFHDVVLQMLPVSSNLDPNRVAMIPNCVDVRRFTQNQVQRLAIRKRLGIKNRTVLVFAGDAARYIFTLPQILSFFRSYQEQDPSAYLLFLAYNDTEKINREIVNAGIGSTDFALVNVGWAEIPAYLSAADIGLAFFHSRSFANSIASPIKFAEYLACGLPVVINPGIGDTARIVEQYRAGIVIDPSDSEVISTGICSLIRILHSDPDLPRRCRSAAEQELSLDLAVTHYAQIYGRLSGR